MIPIAFTESIELRNHIHEIETIRADILTRPVSPKHERRLKWEATATVIHAMMAMAGSSVSRGQIIKILSQPTKHLPAEFSAVLNIKQALEHIEETWTANTKHVTFTSIMALTDILGLLNNRTERTYAQSEPSIKSTIDYLSAQSDHPVILAGIALCKFSTDARITGDAGVLSLLIARIFLSKSGYDVRGLLTVEKQFLANEGSFDAALESHAREATLNHWLLYYAQCVKANLTERLEDLDSPKVNLDLPASFWSLNDRQKSILTYISEPGSSVTNKKVQKLFSVSQITASRDLSRLNTLGLVTMHGKGRSSTYTRS